MRRIRGFKLGKHIRRISNWFLRRRRRSRTGYSLLRSGRSVKPISSLLSWGRRLANGAKSICLSRRRLSYVPLDRDSEEKSAAVPKGHLAVYVGQNDGDFHRVLVPVIYFNHPLFGELLREAEKEYGFHHQGGITIPCPYSEFENVQSKIKSGSSCREPPWKKLGCYGR
ncbi:Auxin-responsive protein SAUR36, partial [Cucurbita argyrosperma subsp. argyrosperma]|uniref:Auxin-responsive protein SAUR36 n=2 Tax=Cucurbita TaxID=3660 RepID=A0A6J1GI02_CUCMO